MLPVVERTVHDELEERRGRLEAVLRSAPSPRLSQLLHEVDSALARVESGHFGVCETCHESIERERLAADPLVRVCLGCLTPEQQQALEHDLELASAIQHKLLPEPTTIALGWEAYYHYEPLGVVSGDHCDLIRPEAGRDDLFLLFGDVSGKGVSASILMAHLQAAFRGLAGRNLPLSETLARANHLFVGCTPASAYATLVCGRLYSDGRLELCNAGHCPPLLRRGGDVTRVHATALPVGLFSNGEFSTRSFKLEPGDALLLYTDGVTDTGDGNGGEYDADRLSGILAESAAESSEDIARACLDDLASFRNGSPRSDDLTLMAIRRR
jgi:sigma-B regulation protein RsbU (phosphoserine phosphatase)